MVTPDGVVMFGSGEGADSIGAGFVPQVSRSAAVNASGGAIARLSGSKPFRQSLTSAAVAG